MAIARCLPLKAFSRTTRWQWCGTRIASFCSGRVHFSSSPSAWDNNFRDNMPNGSHSEFARWHNGGGSYHQSASVDQSACIEIGAIVHSEAIIGKDSYIGSGSIVGPSVCVGQSTKLGYNVILSNCSVGYSCIIHNGASIGQDGFGFYVDTGGNVKKKPQTLNVKIGSCVEIGANTCIDRGSWRDTVIGDQTKIDNLVQIGHNVVIGKCCIICGQAGLAGSVTLGDYVTLGGRVAIRDHVSIASKVQLAANSSVTKDILQPGDYSGFPAVPVNEWRRQIANLRLLSKTLQPKG